MFDSRHFPEPLLNSEQAVALVKVNPNTLLRYDRNGLAVGPRVGNFWRFRASDLDGGLQDAVHTAIDSQTEQRYPVLNHSCPQQKRR